VKVFFKLFRLEGPEFISHKSMKDKEFIIYEKHNEGHLSKFPPGGSKAFIPKAAAQLITNKRSQNFRNWLHTALQPITNYRLENKTVHNYVREPDEVKTKLEWVYGIRCSDTKRPLQYTVSKELAFSTGSLPAFEKRKQENTEELIYFSAAIVVLYNPKLNQQRFYTEHEAEVISLAVTNKSGEIVATAELADHPKIHIWNCKTLENISVSTSVLDCR